MPIDASSTPYDGGLGPDPAGSKIGADDVGVISKSDPGAGVVSKTDPDLESAGTGAKASVGGGIDFGHVEKDPSSINPKANLDLEDAGRGAKVDPSLKEDPTVAANKTGLGSALDHVDTHSSSSKVDVDFAAKHVDIGAAGHDTHDDHIKGLAGHLHDDHDDLHGHGHDDHGHGHDDHAHGHDDHVAKGLHAHDDQGFHGHH